MHAKTINMQLLFLVCFFIVQTQQETRMLNLFEGEVCRKGNGLIPDHQCIRAENCNSLAMDIKNKIYPEICSFDGHKPIVCCSPTILNDKLSKYQNRNIIKEKCDEYAEVAKKYAMPSLLGVIGGTEARPKEFPHMALLGFGDTVDENLWGCGGSLINERWILTAAHCKQLDSRNTARWARLGDLNIAIDTDDAQPKDYRIVQHVIHPDYKPSSRYNDIALFRLETDVEFSAYVRPICLNYHLSLEPQYQIATGWGKTATGEATSDHLLKVFLKTIPADQCNISYFSINDSKLKFGIIPESMVCAGSDNGGHDTCGGDSGGPLQIDNYEYEIGYYYNQVGITSFGAICGDKDKPGVYTRVAHYIPWIQSIVWP